jgi:hypothetical protein
MRHVGVEERRARLAKRHALAPGAAAASVADAAARMVALHATDPATVFLSVAARVPKATVASIERELYDDRTVVRMLGMRRTMFVVPADAVGTIDAACTRAIAARERAGLVKLVEDGGVAKDGARWLKKVEAATLAALGKRGAALASELSQEVPELRQKIVYGAGTKWETVQTVSTRLITVLAADGSMIRASPAVPGSAPSTAGTYRRRGSARRSRTCRWTSLESSWRAGGWRRSGRERRTTSSGGRVGRWVRRARRWRA